MKFKILAECTIYASVALGMAPWVRERTMPAGSSLVRRSQVEAAELRTTLEIPEHVPSVIEFFDFQCPPCRMAYPSIKAVLVRHPNVLYRPVNFPLSIHQYAFGAAVASEIASNDLRPG